VIAVVLSRVRSFIPTLLLVLALPGGLVDAGPAKRPAPEVAPPPPAVVKTVQSVEQPFSCERLTVADGLPNSTTRAMVQDKRGFVWIGTDDGLARYDGVKPFNYRPGPNSPSVPSGSITALMLDDADKLWVGTAENGVAVYDPDTDHFNRYVNGATKGTLSAIGVAGIARDAKNRMWFAMSGGGIDRFEPSTQTFTHFATAPLDVGVTAIAADATGNLWLATTGAVVRWNPNDNTSATFKPVPADAEDVDEVATPAILAASTGKIWIGTDGYGVFILDPATGKLSRQHSNADDPSTLSDDHVNGLFEDRQHTIWIATRKGLNHIDANGKLVRYQHVIADPMSLPYPEVNTVYEDRGGTLWIGGMNTGVCTFTRGMLKFGRYAIPGTLVGGFFEDTDGSLWVGTQDAGLYRYDHDRKHATVYSQLTASGQSVALNKNWIYAIRRDHHGVLWLALGGQGLVGFDNVNGTFRQYRPSANNPNSLPVDVVNDIWEDDQGKLWLSTWGGGLVRFDPQREVFTTFGVETHGITSNYLYKLYPDPTNTKILWIGTAKGGLIRFDTAAETGTSFRRTPDNSATLSNDDVLTIYRDRGGIIWAGTFGGGLNRIDTASSKVESFTAANSELKNDTVLGILPDDDGNLWLSTSGGGLEQFDPKTKKVIAYDTFDGLQDNELVQGSFMRSKSGELFFGAPNGFNAFVPHDITRDAYVPPVVFTGLKVFNRDLQLKRPVWSEEPLELSYSDSFEVQFAALSYAASKKNQYSYKLEGLDDKFTITNRPVVNYVKLGSGNYTLRIRASNKHGVWNDAGIALKIKVAPPFWRTWKAYFVYLAASILVMLLVIRSQRQKLTRVRRESRLALVEQDLALTGAVQSGFLPEKNNVETPQFNLVGYYRPADVCSGDWWWHERLENGRHVVLVGDVTGHGPGPAMVTAAVAAAFRVLVATGSQDLKYALEVLNNVVRRVAKGKYHMTLSALEVEESTGRWQLYNAGAPPLLSLETNGSHKVHFSPGSPLGTENDFELGHLEGVLKPHERFLLYTDGIPEILGPDGKVLGTRWFAKLFERTRAQGLKEAADTLVAQADENQVGSYQADDWTFAILEWNG